jgi:hypothetical protein
MTRLLTLSALMVALAAGGATTHADEDGDPVPARKHDSGTAKSGDYVVKAGKDGIVSATRAKQAVWQANVRGAGDGQVAIVADSMVVVAYDRMQAALDLQSGKMFWQRQGGLAAAKMKVDGARLVFTSGNSREVIDVRTGRLLEKIDGK